MLNNLGVALKRQGKLDEAIACYRKAIELDPKYAIVHNNLGGTLQSQGKLDEAIACWRKAIEVDPKHPMAYNNLGVALHKQGKLKEALTYWQTATELDPTHEGVLCHLVWSLATTPDLDLRDASSAVTYAHKAVELNPADPNKWNNLGVAQYRAGDWPGAVEALQKADAMTEVGDRCHRMFYAMAHWQLGDNEKARKLYAEGAAWIAEHRKDNEEQRRFRTEAEQLMGISEEERERIIEEYVLRGPEDHPDDLEAWFTRASWHAQRGLHGQAISDFDAAIRLAPERANLYAGRGNVYRDLEEWDRALADYQKAIELTPNDVGALRKRRLIYASLEKWDKAIEDQNAIVTLRPDVPAEALIRAQLLLLADRKEEYDEACAEMLDRFGKSENPGQQFETARACSLGPSGACDPTVAVELAERAVAKETQPWTLYFLGLAHLRAGQHEEAEIRFQESLNLGPNWHEKQVNQIGLAIVHHASGEIGKAIWEFDQAVAWMEANPERCRSVLQDWLDALLLRREAEQLLDVSQEQRVRLVEEYLMQQVEERPEDPQAWLDRAEWRQENGLVAKAVEDYGEAIKLKPNDTGLYHARARMRCHLGQWDEAIEDCQEAVQITPKDPWCWRRLFEVEALSDGTAERLNAIREEAKSALGKPNALLVQHAAWHLLSGREEEYARICRNSAEASFGMAVVRTAALVSEPVFDTGELVERASRVVEKTPAKWTRNVLGLCLLRDGQTEEAIARFHESLGPGEEPVNWLGLAIAHATAGRVDDARNWLRKAQDFVRQNPLDVPSALNPGEHITCQVLLREAEQLIEPKPAVEEGSGKKSE